MPHKRFYTTEGHIYTDQTVYLSFITQEIHWMWLWLVFSFTIFHNKVCGWSMFFSHRWWQGGLFMMWMSCLFLKVFQLLKAVFSCIVKICRSCIICPNSDFWALSFRTVFSWCVACHPGNLSRGPWILIVLEKINEIMLFTLILQLFHNKRSYIFTDFVVKIHLCIAKTVYLNQ